MISRQVILAKMADDGGLLRELVMLGYAQCGSIATDAHGIH